MQTLMLPVEAPGITPAEREFQIALQRWLMSGSKLFILMVAVALASGCGAQPGGGSGGSGGGSGGGSAGGSGGGSGGGTGGPVVVGGCPRVLLGSTLPAEFSGDTTSLPNIVTSARLEWTTAPDDALEFTAPSAGNYVIDLTSSVAGLGASAQDYNTTGSNAFPFTRSACPASGSVSEINGVFNHNQPNNPIALTAGQKMVIFISASPFSNPQIGAYVVKVRKLP